MMQIKSFITLRVTPVLLAVVLLFISQADAGLIEGRVFNSESHELLPSVNVTIQNTSLGTATDSDGSFQILNLEAGEYTLQFSSIGFRKQERRISLKQNEKGFITVYLLPTVLHLESIAVTTTRGLRDRFDCPVATDIVNRGAIEQRNTFAMGEVFLSVPGVSLSSTGPGSIRPVIRGLYDVHVLTLLDGIPMNDLRPGGDHVLLLEPIQIEKIEVVRGPGSVLYGSDAVGGLVNFITIPPNPFIGDKIGFSGKLYSGYSSNGGLGQGVVETALGTKAAFLKGRFGHKKSANISDPDKEIPNSNYKGDHLDLMGGLHRDVADLDLVYHYVNADVGVPVNPAFRHSVFEDEKQQFIKFSNTWKPSLRYLTSVETNLSWQRHNRHFHLIKPFELNPDTLEQDMQIFVETDAYNFQVIPATPIAGRSLFKYGLDVFYQTANSDRKSFTTDTFSGVENELSPPRVIPDSKRTDVAFFLQSEFRWQQLSLFAGARHDWVRAESEATVRSPIAPSEKNNQSFSGNLGLVWHLPYRINATSQVGRAFRSPTLLELYFWGPHQTTVDKGNPDLKSETSLNLDFGLNQKQPQYEWGINVFRNTVNDYIYKRRTGVIDTASGLEIDSWENLGDVRLIGGELQGGIYLNQQIGLFANLSYVEGTDIETDDPLQDIPPLNGNLSAQYSSQLLSGELGANWTARQNRIASNETETAAYIVYNGSVG
ncbi:TonB-dependent receptor, partial [bacterium]|nr:TonB-dependent receptor [bacterium]